jgi:hypothetical protein
MTWNTWINPKNINLQPNNKNYSKNKVNSSKLFTFRHRGLYNSSGNSSSRSCRICLIGLFLIITILCCYYWKQPGGFKILFPSIGELNSNNVSSQNNNKDNNHPSEISLSFDSNQVQHKTSNENQQQQQKRLIRQQKQQHKQPKYSNFPTLPEQYPHEYLILHIHGNSQNTVKTNATIRILLRPDLSASSVDYIKQVIAKGICHECRFYRAEKPGILQGIISHSDITASDIVSKGQCPIGYEDVPNDCPAWDTQCGCHGPVMIRGAVGWCAGGKKKKIPH